MLKGLLNVIILLINTQVSCPHLAEVKQLARLRFFNELRKDADLDSTMIDERKKLIRSAYIYANPLPDSIYHKINAKNNGKTMDILWSEVTECFDLGKSVKIYKGQIHIITGRQDPLGYVSYELKILQPSTSLNWIECCGHFPMYEKPCEFYDLLNKIVD